MKLEVEFVFFLSPVGLEACGAAAVYENMSAKPSPALRVLTATSKQVKVNVA